MNEQNTYSDDENVLKEDDLKNVEDIQSSISKMNELGSNEAEGNELLMPICMKTAKISTKIIFPLP